MKNAYESALAMREMAAWVAANAADNPLFDLDNGSVHRTGSWIAKAIRALPLPASSLTTPPEAITEPGPVVSDAADKRDEALGFGRALEIAERGLKAWREKPHNAKWWKRIDGTPIPNDLIVNIAEQFADLPRR